ncbi:Rho guanine nucleotide exchange factor 5 [Plecturocebus cupreus]
MHLPGLRDVRDVSATFPSSDLEENFENNVFSLQVCDLVLNQAPDFRRVYLPYVTNQSYEELTFQSLVNSSSNFREVLEKLESDPVCQRLSLKSFLILPFQRLTRLKLLLQNNAAWLLEEAEAAKAHHAPQQLVRDCNANAQRMRRTEGLIHLSQKMESECKHSQAFLKRGADRLGVQRVPSAGKGAERASGPPAPLQRLPAAVSAPEGGRFLVFDHAPYSTGGRSDLTKTRSDSLCGTTLRASGPSSSSARRRQEKSFGGSQPWPCREELDLLGCDDCPEVQRLRAYKPGESDELALEKADVVTRQSSDGWLEGVRLSGGERGWFPVQQVEFISNPEVCARNLKEAHRVKTAKLQLVEQQASCSLIGVS